MNNTEPALHIGDFIKEELEARNLDIADMARETELDALFLREICDRKRNLALYHVPIIADYFDCSPELVGSIVDAWATYETGVNPQDWRKQIYDVFKLMCKNEIGQCILTRTGNKLTVVLRDDNTLESERRQFEQEMKEAVESSDEFIKLPNGKYRLRDILDADTIIC